MGKFDEGERLIEKRKTLGIGCDESLNGRESGCRNCCCDLKLRVMRKEEELVDVWLYPQLNWEFSKH